MHSGIQALTAIILYFINLKQNQTYVLLKHRQENYRMDLRGRSGGASGKASALTALA